MKMGEKRSGGISPVSAGGISSLPRLQHPSWSQDSRGEIDRGVFGMLV